MLRAVELRGVQCVHGAIELRGGHCVDRAVELRGMSAGFYWIAARSDAKLTSPDCAYTSEVRKALEEAGANAPFPDLTAASSPSAWAKSLRYLEGKVLGLAVIKPRSLSCVLEVLSDQSRSVMDYWLLSKQYGNNKVSPKVSQTCTLISCLDMSETMPHN